ncbi:MAG TPA: trehalose-6-phosphate synthase, partial [Dehalococcoidia bacterium]|nr:trehalose-6-phosphate synthase [Dehalococcoidia bacterium]
WHIPWPNREAFRICPWQQEILDGLLHNDLLAFHIQYHCNNFLNTVDRTVEALVDYERYQISRGGRKTLVRPFPISIDFERICRDAQESPVEEEMDSLRHKLRLEGQLVGLGLDRFDYIKGIPERLRALDRFFYKYPEYRGRVTFVQAGVPSRIHIPAYKRLNEEVDDLVEEINWRHGSVRWKPIICLRQHLSSTTLLALRRMAHFALVSSLHDGMNLVAKEFVASRFDEDGVLILSPFTGAARELTDALLVNPYATDHFAEAIKTAVEMPLADRQRRMRRMRQVVRENNVYDWAGTIVSELAQLGLQ